MFGDLLRYSDRKYIIGDTETEGLHLVTARPWSIAWLVCQGDRILESFDFYLKWPDLKVSEGAARVTRFNPAIIEERGQDPRKVMDIFSSYLYDPQYYVVIHNMLNYDAYIIQNARKSVGLPVDYSFIPRVCDSNALARANEMKIPFNKDRDDFISFQYKMANSPRKGIKSSLAFLGKKYKVDFDENELHGAAKDVQLNFKIWRKLVTEMDI